MMKTMRLSLNFYFGEKKKQKRKEKARKAFFKTEAK